MAAGLADHVWSLQEWLTYPCDRVVARQQSARPKRRSLFCPGSLRHRFGWAYVASKQSPAHAGQPKVMIAGLAFIGDKTARPDRGRVGAFENGFFGRSQLKEKKWDDPLAAWRRCGIPPRIADTLRAIHYSSSFDFRPGPRHTPRRGSGSAKSRRGSCRPGDVRPIPARLRRRPR
jgi:hypothetical protein